jgi:SGNH domain (fused to AT3 domains)
MSLVLAAATFAIVEVPFRRRAAATATRMLLPVLVIVMVFGRLVLTRVIHTRSYPRDEFVQAIRDDWDVTPYTREILGIPVRIAPGNQNAVLWVGDSNAEQFFPRALRLGAENPQSATSVFATLGGCPSLPAVTGAKRVCPPVLPRVHDLVRATGARRVIFASLWRQYFAAGGHYVVTARGRELPLSSPEGRDLALRLLTEVMADLRRTGVAVYVILPIPTGPEFEVTQMFRRNWIEAPLFAPMPQVSRSVAERDVHDVRLGLLHAAAQAGATAIDPFDALCTSTACRTLQPDGGPRYKDGSHLRASYVREHVLFLDNILLNR